MYPLEIIKKQADSKKSNCPACFIQVEFEKLVTKLNKKDISSVIFVEALLSRAASVIIVTDIELNQDKRKKSIERFSTLLEYFFELNQTSEKKK